MIALSKREKNIFVVCLLAVAVYAGYVLIYRPLSRKGNDLSDQVEVAQRQLEKSTRIIKKAKAYESRYQNYMAKFRQTASADEVMSSILTLIEQEAGKFDVRISELKPRQVKKEDLCNNFSVSVVLEGKMPEIVKMLYALQNEPHFFKVEEARFDQQYQKASTLQCQLIISKLLFP